MKIGYVFSNLLMGGIQSFFTEIAVSFNESKEVKYTLLDDKSADPILTNRIGHIQRVSKEELLEWSDIINFDGIINNSDKQFFKPKWKNTLEYLGSARHYSIFERIFKPNLSPHIIACSKFVSKSLKVPNQVIYNGKDTNWYKPINLEKKYDVAIIGRMRPIKNHKLFLDICELGNFSFVTIGGTHRRLEGHINDIEKMCRAKARPGIDHVPGFVSDKEVVKLINQSRIGLLLTTGPEGGPAGAEFMSCGVPLIVRDTGGSAELHEELQELVVPYDAPPSIYVEKIKKYMNDQELPKRARDTILQKYSRDKTISQFDDLYTNISIKSKK
tara:strand:+ start:10375 stop:11361 length:987 start_codon:yes stop_codon:yes gene_type:complete